MSLVFLSPVKSSFFPQNEETGNHNQSRLFQIFRDRNLFLATSQPIFDRFLWFKDQQLGKNVREQGPTYDGMKDWLQPV